jgi:hypothetical protein
LQGGNQGTAWSVKDNGNLAAQLPRLGFERVKIIELDFTVNADRRCTDGAGSSILISASGAASGDCRPYLPDMACALRVKLYPDPNSRPQ